MKKRKEINCGWCGGIFYVIPFRKDIAKFCSRKCMFKYFKKYKIGVFFNPKLQSKAGKIGGPIGGKKAVITNKKNKTGFWDSELQSKLGKKGGHNAQKTLKEKRLGFYNSEIQINLNKRGGSKGGVNCQRVLRENVRNLKFKGQYYDSRPEIEISLCLQEQYNYIPKEGKTLHIRIGNMECDYLLKKLFIEFHCFWKKGDVENLYYKRRRKILNKNGYKDYPLIVIK